MRIAAVIPAYDSAHFLRECLDSVVSQTYPVAEIKAVGHLLDKGPFKNLTGMERWWWRRRCLSAEIYRCALRAREMRSPGRALTLCLRSLAIWPSPFFLPQRYKSLLVYLLSPKVRDAEAPDV